MRTVRACAVTARLGLALVSAAALWPLSSVAQSREPILINRPRAELPVRELKGGESVYIVQLKADAAASYKGGVSGFAATKPRDGGKVDKAAGQVASYVRYLEDTQDRLLAEVGVLDRKVYSYRYAFNGFAVRLRPEEASRLARHADVERIWPDSEQHVQTNNSAVFLGLLNQNGGLRADLNLRGENIVIGVIDSGIAPNHPSLQDTEDNMPRACKSSWARASWLGRWLCHSFRNPAPLYEPPTDFHGDCQQGEGFSIEHCNNKLIGARYYIDGFLFRNDLDAGEFISPKDADGHGTHIATVVAGNPTTASLFGTRIGAVSGIAPRARVAVYKACWLKPGASRASCATSDLARAIDDAVADGVDIINYSIGSLETDLTAPDDFALLNALDAGVLSVVAAGNDGPGAATIGSPSSAPWVLTVGASTQSGTRFEETIEIAAPDHLAGPLLMRQASFTSRLSDSEAVEGSVALVDDGQDAPVSGVVGSRRDACEPLQNAGGIAGQVALIERGGCVFQDKLARVEQAGAIAAIVYNNTGAPIVMNGDPGSIGIPAVMIGTADGQRLVDGLAAGDDIRVRLEEGQLVEQRDTGNRMSSFSSRGPSLSEWDFLKPDVTAPGVNILAGHTPDIANGLSGELFQYLSGTSQSAPETAGIAALLKEAHPDWSPSALKSALMTSAYQTVTKTNGETDADPFDMGAGHIDANRALDPGLVYDADFFDHQAYLCGLEPNLFPPAECDALAEDRYSFAPRDLNLPSIAVGELITRDAVTRRVTNVGPPARYDVTVDAPPGIDLTVRPESFTLDTGQSQLFELEFQVHGAERETWSFGRLSWSDGEHTVASPIAVQPVFHRSPAEISLQGTSGTGVLPVDFGYTGNYFASVHGLHEPGLRAFGFVDDDPTNSFDPNLNNGITRHDFFLRPGELFMRVALFDELTDGNDDLDLYLYRCFSAASPIATCTALGQSGGFTSQEQIDVFAPEAGNYAVIVHGFEPDQIAGGPGANYELFAWSFGADDAGNLRVEDPDRSVIDGDRLSFDYDWGPLDPDTIYLGALLHNTSGGAFISITTVDTL